MTLSRLPAIVVLVFAGTLGWVAGALAQPAVTEHTTPGGIAFRHLAMPGDSHHALAFGWPDGHALTVAGKEGVSVLGPRLLLEGSRGMDQSTRIETLKDLQASISLGGGAHFAVGLLSAPGPKFAETAGLLADLLADPALPPDKLALARRNLVLSSRQQEENAETQANRLFVRLLLGEGPLLRLSVADPAAYEDVQVSDVDAWRRAVLGRDRVVVASAGPMAPAEVAAQIDRVFAGLPATGPAPPLPPPAMRASGKLIVLERPVVQTAIVAGGPSGWTVEAETLRATMAVRVLGGGFESRLIRAVRERLGAAYGIRASLRQLHPKAISLVIGTAVDTSKAAATLAAIRSEYERLLAEGVTDAEIAPWKTKLLDEMRGHTRRSPGAAGRLRDLALGKFPNDFFATYEARVRALNAEEVNDGIKTHFTKLPLTIVVVAPSAEGLGADCVIKAAAEISRCE